MPSLALGLCECKEGAGETLSAHGENDEARLPRGEPGLAVSVAQAVRTASACGPFSPWTTSKLTRWPSSRLL